MGKVKNYRLKSYCIISLITLDLLLWPHRAQAIQRSSYCLSCHTQLSPELSRCVEYWSESVHAYIQVGCEDCHGGDPNHPYQPEKGQAGYIGVPDKAAIPAFCDRCHADPLYLRKYNIRVDEENCYQQSRHGYQLLIKGNLDVASCVNCHGSHGIRKVDDPKSLVNHLKIAETCAECHSNEELMKPYGLPTNQYAIFRKSYHGLILYKQIEGKNPRLAPSCPGCHGIHSGKPTGTAKVADACKNCHLSAKRYFQKGIHSLIIKKNLRPQCIDCHGYHDVNQPSEEALLGQGPRDCGGCHQPKSREYRTAKNIYSLLTQARQGVQKTVKTLNQKKSEFELDMMNLDLKINDVLNWFEEAKSATHSQEVETVNEVVQKILKKVETVNQSIEAYYQERRQRKQWLAKVLFSILFLFLLILYQRTRLKK